MSVQFPTRDAMLRRTFAILLSALAFVATVNAGKTATDAPEGMVWIPGGEFSMGAAVNGHGSCEMAMPSNDAEPIHRVPNTKRLGTSSGTSRAQ